MIKLPKSIIKKWGITKRAWAEYRKSKGGKSPRKKKHHAAKHRHVAKKSGEVSRSQTNGGKKMAKRKHKVRHSVRRAGRRLRIAAGSGPVQTLTMAGIATVGGVVSAYGVNAVASKSDANTKALIQGGIGLGLVMFVKNRHIKSLGAGAVIAGLMGLAKSTMNLSALAGPSAGSRTLTPSELRRVTGGQMSMPLPGTMHIPLGSAPANAGFNRGGFGS